MEISPILDDEDHPGMHRLRSMRNCRGEDQGEMENPRQKNSEQLQENICTLSNSRQGRGHHVHRCRCRAHKGQGPKDSLDGDKIDCPCNDMEVEARCKLRGKGSEYERSRSLNRLTSVSENGILVITLSDTEEVEDDGDAKWKVKPKRNFELDRNQDDALEYMATPVEDREEDKVAFNPTFLIDDGKYRVVERLGSGAYGNVYKVKDRSSGKMRALKVVRKDRTIDPDEKESILREINSLTIIKNQNPPAAIVKVIVRLLKTFRLRDHQCILYELLGPTLHDVMKQDNFQDGWNWKEIRKICYQMLIGINYLHSLELVHHDIKPENVCFGRDYEIGCGMEPRVKLLDFGSCVSRNFRDGRIATTLRYRAPEIGLSGSCTFGADMWSLGCSFFEIYTGRPLFPLVDNTDEIEKFYMMEAILCDVIPRRLAVRSGLSCFDGDGNLKYEDENKPKIKAIHEKIMPLEEYNRTPKIEAACSFFDLVKKLLSMKSSTRIDSYASLHHPFFNHDLCHKEYEPLITPTSLDAFIRKSSRPMSFEMKDDVELRRLYGATPRSIQINRVS